MPKIAASFSLFLWLVITIACGQQGPPPEPTASQPSQPQPEPGISVMLRPTQGNSAEGTLSLMTMGDGVHFSGTITGLPAGAHGFHVHETGDCSAPDASSAGGHFNPGGKQHGAPDSPEHHAGDLGNIEADASGTANVNVHAAGVTLDAGENSVKGKAVILHAAPDDFKTQPTGNAGARLACGVIP